MRAIIWVYSKILRLFRCDVKFLYVASIEGSEGEFNIFAGGGCKLQPSDIIRCSVFGLKAAVEYTDGDSETVKSTIKKYVDEVL